MVVVNLVLPPISAKADVTWYSGVVNSGSRMRSSNTRCRGASNIRVMTISRSDGVVIFKVLSILASTLLLLVRLLPGSRFGFHALIGLQICEIIVQAIEAL